MAAPIRAGIEIRNAHFPGRAPIDAYGNGGFRFADMSHQGSILALPSGIYGWDIADFDTLDAPSLSRVTDEADAIEVLLIGCGPDLQVLDKNLRQSLRDNGLAVETMATGAAVRTFNVLLAEDRAAAAALIAVDKAR